jgi:hypothetical protein
MKVSCKLLLLLVLSAVAFPQTTLTNNSGACTTAVSCTLLLNAGTGNVTFSAVVGPSCPLGQSCSFPSAYVGTHFAYQLPDGSSGDASNFSGSLTYTGVGSCGAGCSAYYYSITGTFSGQDSLGRNFTGSTQQGLTISSVSRGGDSARDTGGVTTLEFTGGSVPSPTTLAFMTPLPSALALGGSIGQVMVGVEDNAGHAVTSSTVPITLSLAGPSGFATVTQVGNASQGVATFALPSALTIPGQYTLGASSNGLTSPSSLAISVGQSTGGTLTPDFALTANQTTLTVSSGQSATVTLALAPLAGYADTVTFSCSGLPASTSCAFNPMPLTVAGSNVPLTTQMTISNVVVAGKITPSQRQTPSRPARSLFFVALLPAVLLCSKSRGLRKAAQVLMVTVLLACVTGAVSCGGSPSSTAALQSATNSSIVVTAVGSHGVAHSVTINLTLTK